MRPVVRRSKTSSIDWPQIAGICLLYGKLKTTADARNRRERIQETALPRRFSTAQNMLKNED